MSTVLSRFAALMLMGALMLLLGCSADLVVNKADPMTYKGIRVYTIANFKVTKEIVFGNANCPQRTVENIIQLPDEPYDITVDTSWNAKSEFTVMFTDNGLLKQVSLNSTPQTAENINAMANLAKAIADAVPKPPIGFNAADCGATTERIVNIKRCTTASC